MSKPFKKHVSYKHQYVPELRRKLLFTEPFFDESVKFNERSKTGGAEYKKSNREINNQMIALFENFDNLEDSTIYQIISEEFYPSGIASLINREIYTYLLNKDKYKPNWLHNFISKMQKKYKSDYSHVSVLYQTFEDVELQIYEVLKKSVVEISKYDKILHMGDYEYNKIFDNTVVNIPIDYEFNKSKQKTNIESHKYDLIIISQIYKLTNSRLNELLDYFHNTLLSKNGIVCVQNFSIDKLNVDIMDFICDLDFMQTTNIPVRPIYNYNSKEELIASIDQKFKLKRIGTYDINGIVLGYTVIYNR